MAAASSPASASPSSAPTIAGSRRPCGYNTPRVSATCPAPALLILAAMPLPTMYQVRVLEPAAAQVSSRPSRRVSALGQSGWRDTNGMDSSLCLVGSLSHLVCRYARTLVAHLCAATAASLLIALPLQAQTTNNTGTLVRFSTPLGPIDLALDDTGAPRTVANFLQYVRQGLYDGSFLHRLAFLPNTSPRAPFVLQGEDSVSAIQEP